MLGSHGMKSHTVDLSHRIKRKRGKYLQNFWSLIPNPLTGKRNQFWNCGQIKSRFKGHISVDVSSMHGIFNPKHACPGHSKEPQVRYNLGLRPTAKRLFIARLGLRCAIQFNLI